jgi:hypothetical protein
VFFEQNVVELRHHGVEELLSVGFQKQTVGEDERTYGSSKQAVVEREQSVGFQEQTDGDEEPSVGCSKQFIGLFAEADVFFFHHDVKEQ